MKKLLSNVHFFLMFLTMTGIISAQTPIENQINIWPGVAPGSESVDITEDIQDRMALGACHLDRAVQKVTVPTIKHFAPENPNGTAVILCPGGAYYKLAYDKEGYDIAEWYAERDITAFVLKYRLPSDGHENRQFVPLQDAQRAIRFVRAHADSFNIDTNKIGIMGGSAGGHLAANLSTAYDWKVYESIDSIDAHSTKPNFTVLMYPVVSFQDSLTHTGSRSNLLGNDYTKAQVDSFSPELQVTDETPPAFMAHSKLDGVTYRNSVAYSRALNAAGVENSLNIYKNGDHGVGICVAGKTAFSHWPYDLDDWLVEMELTTPCLGDKPVITYNQDDSTQLTASSASGYQWFKDGILLDNATSETYTATKTAKYSVAVPGVRETSGSSCIIFSDEVPVKIVVVEEKQEALNETLKLYPNPANTEINFYNEKIVNSTVNYEIYNDLGRNIQSENNISFNQDATIDISDLNTGMYFVLISTESKTFQGKFFKE